MALAVAVKSTTMSQSEIVLNFQVTASGNYTAGGDTLDFYSATYPPGGPNLAATLPPRFVEILSQPSSGDTSSVKYVYSYAPGTDPSNGLMQVFGTGTASQDPLNEIPGAPTAYPVAVTGDTIVGRAYFTKEV